ncbi:snoRNA-binding rRNA-processing protein [Balamuthia mandrillaris]
MVNLAHALPPRAGKPSSATTATNSCLEMDASAAVWSMSELMDKLDQVEKRTLDAADATNEDEGEWEVGVEDLPSEVFVLIFSYLEGEDLFAASRTCFYWYSVAQERLLWKQLLLQQVPMQKRATVEPKLKQSVDYLEASGSNNQSGWKWLWQNNKRLKGRWNKGNFQRGCFTEGHDQAIFCLSFDRNYLLTGSSDHTAKVWSTTDHSLLHTLKGHSYAVWSVKVIQDRGRLVTASYDSTIKLWNAASGECESTLQGHTSAIWATDYHDTLLASGSTDATIRLWDLEKQVPLRVWEGEQDTVWSCQLLDGNTLVTGGSDTRIWDLRKPFAPSEVKPVAVLDGHTDGVRCLQADDFTVVSGSYDATAKIWDRRTGKSVHKLEEHEDSITTLQFDDFGRLVTSSFDGTFKVWDLQTGKSIISWDGFEDEKENYLHKSYALQFEDSRMYVATEGKAPVIYVF